jgi:hypothetical protein
LNVQAVCNHRLQFIFFGSASAPGKCGNQVAFERTSLPALMHALPVGRNLIGDAAYSVSKKCSCPLRVSNKTIEAKTHTISTSASREFGLRWLLG